MYVLLSITSVLQRCNGDLQAGVRRVQSADVTSLYQHWDCVRRSERLCQGVRVLQKVGSGADVVAFVFK